MRSLKLDKTTSQDLSLGALSYTTDYGRRFKIEGIYFKSSVAITETITITLDSKNGANYDSVLRSKTLNAESSYVFIPGGENNFYAGDEIKIQCTNANLTGIVYVTIKSSEVLI